MKARRDWALLAAWVAVYLIVGLALVLAAIALLSTPARAAPCVPDLATYTPTPTIAYDHDERDVALYRVYAQREGDVVWPWHLDLPVWPGDATSDPVFPGVSIDVPVQRAVPTDVQLETVRVMVKAVDASNVESAPSNVIVVCMPEIWARPEAYR